MGLGKSRDTQHTRSINPTQAAQVNQLKTRLINFNTSILLTKGIRGTSHRKFRRSNDVDLAPNLQPSLQEFSPFPKSVSLFNPRSMIYRLQPRLLLIAICCEQVTVQQGDACIEAAARANRKLRLRSRLDEVRLVGLILKQRCRMCCPAQCSLWKADHPPKWRELLQKAPLLPWWWACLALCHVYACENVYVGLNLLRVEDGISGNLESKSRNR